MSEDLYKADPQREDPANLFVRRMVAARQLVLRSLKQELVDGPPGTRPRSAAVERHAWFCSLNAYAQRMAMEIAREAVDGALYVAMSELDDSDPTPDHRMWDFSAYVQIYRDFDSYEADNPEYRSRKLNLNPDTRALHDRYQILIEEVDSDVRAEWNGPR